MSNRFLNFHVDKERILQSETAVSLAKQETGFADVDPIVAQKRAILVCKLEQLENQLSATKVNQITNGWQCFKAEDK